jgi:uncharacterized protein (DUF427 family)
MSVRMCDLVAGVLGELRHEPTEKRVRALAGDETVVDSERAALVWEPRRVVPSYAVPVEDVRAELVATETRDPVAGILHPRIPFTAHSSDGEAVSLGVGDALLEGAGFRPADPALAGYVVLDWHAFDAWYEEDVRLVGHPRDPYHRVDIRFGSRSVRIERDGAVLAESNRPCLVFETNLPLRFYLPREDVVAEMRPSARRTQCAYKGEASYWSFDAGPDLAWSYEEPLGEAAALTGLVAFFDERVDVVVDGTRRERPRSMISAAILAESGV